MKSWRPVFERISKALEFANIDSLRELETLLEQREEQNSTLSQPSKRQTGRFAASRRTIRHGATLNLSGTR
jgi:hypothetical protein